MAHKFSPESIERLLSEERHQRLKPKQLLQGLGLGKAMVVADVGCGPGFFTIPAATVVGRTGIVYAIDVQEQMLRMLKRRTRRKNVVPIHSKENRIPLKASVADFSILAYVLHEATNRLRFLKEVRRIMKKGGRLVLIDWKKKRQQQGPPFDERVSVKEATGLVKDAGFSIESVGSLDQSHYIITALK